MSFLSNFFGALFPSAPSAPAAVPAPSPEVAAISNVLAFLRPIGADFEALHTAWIENNLQAELAAGLPIVEALLKIVTMVYPPAAVAENGIAIFGAVLPVVIPALIEFGEGLVPDGRGGLVTPQWIAAHQLDPEGDFET
ncbi:MAG: hypothetical protein WDN46_20630 [Methylocella sp.]